ncbi:MAG: selenide, water dikinase SelD [Acidobacteria bacterium]|nr:selenide, water dikinase SelD [Acidobacteriota bacterium]MYD72027.1 selenide, water dikinase SelD [Acidobacteriota bacterium]MYJ03074.1 selenide, water dikinase SelD [Acidobacteriota bacterium]
MTGDHGSPVLKDLVLVGGGHTHVIVLRRFGMRPIPGVRITLIARDLHAPYSGMLPGLIAGHYTFDDAHIDLAPLARFANARLFHDEAVGLDLDARAVICRDRPPVPYDLLSIDVGITPSVNVEGVADHAVPVKPIGGLVARWERLAARVRASEGPLRIAVVGAGAAGVELTLAIQHALSNGERETGAATGASAGAPTPSEASFHLFGAEPVILPTHGAWARRRFERVLAKRGVELHVGSRVIRVAAATPGAVRLHTEDGGAFEAHEVIWATEAAPPAWPARAGLAVDGRGFIEVDATLRSTSHPQVFAAGDVASVAGHRREKAGVFAVRQGPPLEANLRRALEGDPIREFHPQRKFLSLISTGNRYAVASRGRLSLEGAWVWRWKDRIDRHFMQRFSDLPQMDGEPVEAARRPAPPAPGLVTPEAVEQLTRPAMLCGGCGSKIGATLLDRVLARLHPFRRDDVLIGLDAPDDAAVEQLPPGALLVQSVDAFRAMVDDPWVFGRITATHSLGDLYAMGADPRSALAVVTIPHGIEEKMETLLFDLLAGALAVLNDAGVALTGGHTSEGAELTFGLSVTGTVQRDRMLRKGGARPGDRFIVTKPLGTGTLLAADMRGKAKARWVAGAIRTMLQSNRAAAGVFRQHGAHACTDVTGFGLLGHLVEMARASGVGARIHLDAIQLLGGAEETVAAGIVSSLQPENLRLRRAVANPEAAAGKGGYPILFDPQTSGGLLAAVPADRADMYVAMLQAAGYDHAADIGEAVPVPLDGASLIEIA